MAPLITVCPLPQVSLESATPHTLLIAASPMDLPSSSQTPFAGEIDSCANYCVILDALIAR